MPKARLAACAALAALAVTGCTTSSPPQQKARERKAAGVVLFRIHCSKDLWAHTGADTEVEGGYGHAIPAKITDELNGLVTVELSGPNLVDLLNKLDFMAHGGWGSHDPMAARLYDAIAPRVDAIQATPQPGAPVPEVTIDDHVGPTSGTPTPTASPKK